MSTVNDEVVSNLFVEENSELKEENKNLAEENERLRLMVRSLRSQVSDLQWDIYNRRGAY